MTGTKLGIISLIIIGRPPARNVHYMHQMWLVNKEVGNFLVSKEYFSFLIYRVTCNCLELQIVENSIKVYKGTNPEVDSYSVFWDNKKLTETSLVSQLQEKNATDIYICGLAYDVCVGKLVSVMIS